MILKTHSSANFWVVVFANLLHDVVGNGLAREATRETKVRFWTIDHMRRFVEKYLESVDSIVSSCLISVVETEK